MSDELTPITRKETFLAKAGGQNVVTPTPITREETFLQAIIDSGSGGGGGSSELPEVTAEDNGDVLTVVNGKWDKASGGGTGGGVFVVTIENDMETYSNPSATFAEMLSANEDGKAIILVIKNTQDANGSQYGLRNITTTEAVFQSFYADSNPTYLEAVLITCTSSNVWSSDGVTIIGD